MQGAVRFLISNLTTNLPGNFPENLFYKIRLDFTELWPQICGPTFLAHPVLEALCDYALYKSTFYLLTYLLMCQLWG